MQQGVTAIFEKSYYSNLTTGCFLILYPVILANAGINLDFSTSWTKGLPAKNLPLWKRGLGGFFKTLDLLYSIKIPCMNKAGGV